MTDQPKCKTCKWWVLNSGKVSGHDTTNTRPMVMFSECHRFPPTPNPSGFGDWWPCTQPSNFCGEHTLKDTSND